MNASNCIIYKHFHCTMMWHINVSMVYLCSHIQSAELGNISTSHDDDLCIAPLPRPLSRVKSADKMVSKEQLVRTVSLYGRITHRCWTRMVKVLVESVNIFITPKPFGPEEYFCTISGRWSGIREGGQACGSRLFRNHISKTAGRILSTRSSMELSGPKVVQHYGCLPISHIWAKKVKSCTNGVQNLPNQYLSNQLPDLLWYSMELSRPVVVHFHGHLPICPIWVSPWTKTCQVWYQWSPHILHCLSLNLLDGVVQQYDHLPIVGLFNEPKLISETIVWIFSIQNSKDLSRLVQCHGHLPIGPIGFAHRPDYISLELLVRFPAFDVLWNCPNIYM